MVILPARDEGPRVGAVVRAVRRALPGVPVVVVENGSVDDTAFEAKAAGATVIHSAPGYAIATHAGFRYAMQHDVPWVITLDADGQHPPEQLPSLLVALGHSDMVVGSRFLGRPGYPVAPHRRAANAMLAAWASWLTGQRLCDVTSGMRAMRRDVVAEFAREYPNDVADANVLVRVLRRGWRVVEVPVEMCERAGGRSMHDTPMSALFALRMAVYSAREAVAAG
jgi:glycosyltransferase involved in cell wall biosynthesis